MNVFHLVFAIAIGFLSLAFYEIYKRSGSGNAGSNPDSKRKLAVIAFSIAIGVLLSLASVPGAFFDQPYWLTDKIYWIVKSVVGDS